MRRESEYEYETPLRTPEGKEVETTHDRQPASPYQSEIHQGSQSNGNEEKEELQRLEAEIAHREARLTEIKIQKMTIDEFSDENMRLEDQQRCLRQDLAQLDFNHKQIYLSIKKKRLEAEKLAREEDRRHYEEQKKEAEIQRLERSRKTQERLRQIQEEGLARRQRLEKELKGVSPEKGQKDSMEAQEAEDRHKARLNQIQLELATDRLRRSRQIALETELVSLRSYYPYWTRPYYSLLYRPYSYLTPYYPYSRYDPYYRAYDSPYYRAYDSLYYPYI